MADRYSPDEFESKWRERWAKSDLFKTRTDTGRPKFYGMDFFPYPSGAGLSVGHCRNYVPTDVICRMKYMQGYNVLHPMGFDAFGLPAENEAIKRQSHPAPMIEQYANTYKRQMELISVSYDWSRSFKSSDPSYYKWTQSIFEILHRRGLAYRRLAAVNWDPIDKTVLADEEIIGGRAERSGALVEKKWIPQWFFKITDYAQRLIDDLEDLEWPEGIKAQQRNWIGRSEGAQFSLKVDMPGGDTDTHRFDLDSDQPGPARALSFDVFTTRIDTIFGMSFCVLSPEHGLVEKLPVSEEDRARIAAYQEEARQLSDADRTSLTREKTGVFTGAYAINPINGRRVPIWLADYVLANYGTGAIMAVPAHDQRDFDFAVKFGLDVIPVIRPTEEYLQSQETTIDDYLADPKKFSQVFESKESTLLNSGEYDGLAAPLAQLEIGMWIEANGIGERKIQYKLRDWLISRQRYWGCPIPVIHTVDGDEELVPVNQLPVELPVVDNYEPSGDGTSPLAHIQEFVNCTDSEGRMGRRETDTMGGFACSSWYFLRFTDPDNFEEAWSKEVADYWMPVDCYVGGAEHAVMHLLYARFWTKVLYDEGLISVKEPFARLQNQGQVLAHTPYRRPREDERLDVGEDGILVSFEEAKAIGDENLTWKWARMSKSKGNVVTPDQAVADYGADALRQYLLFVAPFNADIQWSNEGMQGMVRFLSRIFKWVEDVKPHYHADWKALINFEELDETSKKIRRITHQTIKNCTDDIERFSFNTYISWMMKFMNELSDLTNGSQLQLDSVRSHVLAVSEAVETVILLLSPSAPHSADELWESLGKEGFTYHAEWPVHDPSLMTADTLTLAVQVNGKLRDTLEVPSNSNSEQLEAFALQSAKVQAHTEGKTVRIVIVVQGKLVNIVVS